MLVKMLPAQVANTWDDFEAAINETMLQRKYTDPDISNRVLMSVLGDEAQCWVSIADEKIIGIVITTVVNDIWAGNKSLMIYLIYSYGKSEMEDWIDGLETLKKFAASIGCDKVVAYTPLPQLAKMGKMLHADVEYYISINVA